MAACPDLLSRGDREWLAWCPNSFWVRRAYASSVEECFPVEARWEAAAWASGRNNRPNGVLGWLQLKVDGEWTSSKRVHICTFRACPTLLWPDSKWGLYGPPLHYHYEPHPPEATVVAPVAASAVAVAPSGPAVEVAFASLEEADATEAPELLAAEATGSGAPGVLAAERGEDGAGPVPMDTEPLDPACQASGFLEDESDSMDIEAASAVADLGLPEATVVAELPAPEVAPLVSLGELLSGAVPPAADVAAARVPMLEEAMDIGNPPAADPAGLNRVIAVARSVRPKCSYVGYAAFLALALCKKLRVMLWAGDHAYDLVATFAPWADLLQFADCPVLAVACVYRVDEVTGATMLWPISADLGEHNMNHFVAAVTDVAAAAAPPGSGSGDDLSMFYSRLGLAVQETIADGDCGLDVMCLMLGLERKAEARDCLRQELSSWLLEHAADEQLQTSFGWLGEDPEPMLEPAVAAASEPVVEIAAALAVVTAGKSSDDHPGRLGNAQQQAGEPSKEDLEALEWACGLKGIDAETVRAVHKSLEGWVVKEQLEKYQQFKAQQLLAKASVEAGSPEGSNAADKERSKMAKPRRSYVSSKLSDRLSRAKVFAEWCKLNSIPLPQNDGDRLPQGAFARFARQDADFKRLCSGPNGPKEMRRQRLLVLRGLRNLPKATMLATVHGGGRAFARADGKKRYVRDAQRRKVPGVYAVHLKKAPLVREQLFEWFCILRHSVRVRVPPVLVELKAKQLVQDYITASLRNGQQPKPPVITRHWLKEWQMEYRVSFRKPNRKFKVAKAVLEERLSLFWLNVTRVRALAVARLGYDLEVWNLDQSPFHMNESGAKALLPCS